MQAIANIDVQSLLDTFVSVSVAFVLGSVIGFERQWRQRTAGLRTNALVAVGAAVFVDLAERLTGHDGAVRVIAYVVSGIGFLGAGAIMKEGANVTGLNTAATLWGSAAVGACAGADLVGESLIATLFVLASNTLLRPVANRINRQPVQEAAAEATYTVYVVCTRERQADLRERLIELLEAADYPVRDLSHHAFGQADTEIAATLFATAINVDEVERVIVLLESEAGVKQAFWNAGTEE